MTDAIDLYDSDEDMLEGIDADRLLEGILNESDSEEESTNETIINIPKPVP